MFILFHHHPVIPSSVLCVKQYIRVRALRTLQYLKKHVTMQIFFQWFVQQPSCGIALVHFQRPDESDHYVS